MSTSATKEQVAGLLADALIHNQLLSSQLKSLEGAVKELKEELAKKDEKLRGIREVKEFIADMIQKKLDNGSLPLPKKVKDEMKKGILRAKVQEVNIGSGYKPFIKVWVSFSGVTQETGFEYELVASLEDDH